MVKLLNTVGRVHGLVTFMMGSTDEHPHRFFGNGWRLVLMGVVLQGEDDPTRFLLYEAYQSKDDFTEHQQTPHYLKWRETVKDWMAQPRVGVKHYSIFFGDGEG